MKREDARKREEKGEIESDDGMKIGTGEKEGMKCRLKGKNVNTRNGHMMGGRKRRERANWGGWEVERKKK